jgi:hypothetical protein
LDPDHRTHAALFQDGSRSLANDNLHQAEINFKELAGAQPQSPAARIGLGTAQAARLGPDNPQAAAVLAQTANWASIQDSKALPRSLTQPQMRDLAIRGDAENVTDAWLAYHLHGLTSLHSLSL